MSNKALEKKLAAVYLFYDREPVIQVIAATVKRLSSFAADRVTEALDRVIAGGGWTRDKTLLSVVLENMPKQERLLCAPDDCELDTEEFRQTLRDVIRINKGLLESDKRLYMQKRRKRIVEQATMELQKLNGGKE